MPGGSPAATRCRPGPTPMAATPAPRRRACPGPTRPTRCVGATTKRAGASRAAPRPGRSAPDPHRDSRSGGAASAGPPALPVIVLIAVVAVLVLGVAWLVITGDEAEAPASDRPSADAADDDTGDGEGAGAAAGAAGAPTGVAATQVPEGIQVTWTGPQDGSYVVTVLAPDQPPQALPPSLGTSAPGAERRGPPPAVAGASPWRPLPTPRAHPAPRRRPPARRARRSRACSRPLRGLTRARVPPGGPTPRRGAARSG